MPGTDLRDSVRPDEDVQAARRIASKFRSWIPVVVSLAVFAWLLSRDDIDLIGVATSVRPDQLLWLSLILILYGVISLAIEAYCLVRTANLPVERFGLWTAARIKAASYLAYVVHYGVGVGALSVLLHRRSELSVADAAGVILLIAAYDLGLTLAVASLGALLIGGDQYGIRAGVVIALGAVALGGFALLRAPFSLGPFERIRQWKVFRASRETSLARLLELLAVRGLFVVCFFAMASLALGLFGINPPPGELFVSASVVILVTALPIAVAGFGPAQIAFVEMFRGYADGNTLLACSLVLWGGLIAVRALTGLLFAREFAREALQVVREEQL